MAKKAVTATKKAMKIKAEKPVSEPTQQQLDLITTELLRHNSNVYYVAEAILGYKPDSELIFVWLLERCKIFRCELCSTWMETCEEDKDLSGICVECVEKMNESMRDD